VAAITGAASGVRPPRPARSGRGPSGSCPGSWCARTRFATQPATQLDLARLWGKTPLARCLKPSHVARRALRYVRSQPSHSASVGDCAVGGESNSIPVTDDCGLEALPRQVRRWPGHAEAFETSTHRATCMRGFVWRQLAPLLRTMRSVRRGQPTHHLHLADKEPRPCLSILRASYRVTRPVGRTLRSRSDNGFDTPLSVDRPSQQDHHPAVRQRQLVRKPSRRLESWHMAGHRPTACRHTPSARRSGDRSGITGDREQSHLVSGGGFGVEAMAASPFWATVHSRPR
jgi:hypothetical protein